MFGGILNIFIFIWLFIKNVSIIPQHKTGQIKLKASYLKKKQGAPMSHELFFLNLYSRQKLSNNSYFLYKLKCILREKKKLEK